MYIVPAPAYPPLPLPDIAVVIKSDVLFSNALMAILPPAPPGLVEDRPLVLLYVHQCYTSTPVASVLAQGSASALPEHHITRSVSALVLQYSIEVLTQVFDSISV